LELTLSWIFFIESKYSSDSGQLVNIEAQNQPTELITRDKLPLVVESIFHARRFIDFLPISVRFIAPPTPLRPGCLAREYFSSKPKAHASRSPIPLDISTKLN
jgi:hypothetical protein